jgi:GTPase
MLILSAIYDNSNGFDILKPFMNEFAFRSDEGIVKKKVDTIYNVEGLDDIKTGEVYMYGIH